MRTGKSVTQNGTTTEYTYVYENGLLLQMTRGSRVYDFSYDANGTPISIAYRTRATATPSYYYYGTNWRGDVVALYSSSGLITALYEYDAYGNVTVKSSNGQVNTSETHIANINPLRYRGYVYDTETGLYYLQSRYYDPIICRFVNEDIYYDTGIGLTGLNMFTYCNNSPVMSSDFSGTYPTYTILTYSGQIYSGIPTHHLGYYGQIRWCKKEDDSTQDELSGGGSSGGIPVGGAITSANNFLDISLDTTFWGAETGTSMSSVLHGDFNKPVTLYFQRATEWWRLSEYSVGGSVNILGVGYSFARSPFGAYRGVSYNNYYLEWQVGIDKIGYTYSSNYGYREHDIGNYTHVYVRPWTTAAAAVLVYGTCGAALPLLNPAS